MHPHASAHKHAAEHTPVGAPVSAAEADFKVSHNMTLHVSNGHKLLYHPLVLNLTGYRSLKVNSWVRHAW